MAQIKVDASRANFKLPVLSILGLLALLPLGFQINKYRQNKKQLALLSGVTALIVVGSILLFPYLQVSIAKPAVLVPQLGDKAAEKILESLLRNVYRSFDFREEEDVYDRLATSVSGDLLSAIYLQNRKSLIVTQAGGARARVKEIEIIDVKVDHPKDRPLALLFRSKWTAMGTVGHWGHIHTRKNRYEANITVEPVDGAWKITHLELLEEKRIDPYANPKA